MKLTKLFAMTAIASALSACSVEVTYDDDEPTHTPMPEPTATEALRTLVYDQDIVPFTPNRPDLPSVEEPLAQLGMQLFFSKALSGDMDTACVTCHHPLLGGGDDLALSIGVEAVDEDLIGPGRLHDMEGHDYDGGPTVPRNAPTTFNIGLWERTIFHDGRLENLSMPPSPNGLGDEIRTPETPLGVATPNAGNNLAAAQSKFPVTSPEEMRGHTFQSGESNPVLREALSARLRGDTDELVENNWLAEFQAAFASDDDAETLINYDNISLAIGEYERSQFFVDNAWAEFLNGDDDAISESAKRGALLFFASAEEGGYDCAACHSGAFFSDENFHVVAMPQIGRGKGDSENGSDDFGRFRETGVAEDRYAFRTPSLLNVAKTLPYGHAGAYQTLEQVVSHHINPSQAIEGYDPTGVQEGIQTDHWYENTLVALYQLEALQLSGDSMLTIDDQVADEDVEDLVEFLHTLTDQCVMNEDCLADWIPSENTPNPDGLRLEAYFQ